MLMIDKDILKEILVYKESEYRRNCNDCFIKSRRRNRCLYSE